MEASISAVLAKWKAIQRWCWLHSCWNRMEETFFEAVCASKSAPRKATKICKKEPTANRIRKSSAVRGRLIPPMMHSTSAFQMIAGDSPKTSSEAMTTSWCGSVSQPSALLLTTPTKHRVQSTSRWASLSFGLSLIYTWWVCTRKHSPGCASCSSK